MSLNSNVFKYVFSSINIGGSIVTLLGIVVFMHKYCRTKSMDKQDTYCFSMILAILFSISLVVRDFCYGISLWIDLEKFNYHMFDLCVVVFARSCGIGYFVFILHQKFRNAEHSISFISLTIIGLLYIGMVTTSIFFMFNQESYIARIIQVSTLEVLLLVFLTLMLYKFNRFGFHVTRDYKNQVIYAESLNKYVNIKQEFEDNIDNVSVSASKVFIIGIIFITLEQFIVISSVLLLLNDGPVFSISTEVSILLSNILGPWLVMLYFPFMDSWYQCCLGKCHHRTRTFCTTKFRKTVNEPLMINENLLNN